MKLVVDLDDPEAQDPALAGEKAATLARLRAAGLPVPPGFIVPATAFADATRSLEHTLATQLARSRAADALHAGAEALQAAVNALAVDTGLREAIADAYQRLSAGDAVAVRSSATAEDLPGASFAGQYESYLNVVGTEAVIGRVRAVWASLYSAQALSYRRHVGIDDGAVRMAVLVMLQLRPEASGVLFTRDPISGNEDRMHLNVALGLGEGVVGGHIPVDVFALDARSFAVVDRVVVQKPTMVAAMVGGGTGQMAVAPGRRAAPALNDGQLEAVGQLAQRVVQLEGGHRDIEFSLARGAFHLLQARPITGVTTSPAAPTAGGGDGDIAVPAFPVAWADPADEQFGWTLNAFGSGGRPTPRLLQDVARVYNEHAAIAFADTSMPMAANHVICFVNGRQYGRTPAVAPDALRERTRGYAVSAQRYLERGSSLYAEEIEPETLARLARLGRYRRAVSAPLAERFEHFEAALASYGRVMGDLHWRMAAASGPRNWAQRFHELTGEPESEAVVFLQAIENRTTELVRRLRALARLAQAEPLLLEALRARAYESLSQPPLAAHPAVRRFHARTRALLRAFGRRTGRGFGSASTTTDPTWNMDHAQPLELVRLYADQDLEALDRLERDARRERRNATLKIRRRLARDPERLAAFDRARLGAQAQVRMMENHNHLMEQGVAGVLTEAIAWLGKGIAGAGHVDDPADLLHLTLDEVREAVTGSLDLRPLVDGRREEFARWLMLTPPSTLGRGRPFPMEPPRDGEPLPKVGLDGTRLYGLGVSRGRRTGRARVVTPGRPLPQVEGGDILVAVNAGPDWTPVLSLLGGIVLDQGVAFQHAALVAREYRVPCVLQTREGTKVIRDGQTVTVDGDAGVVELA
ncbi:MAG: PEP/pyruvate-binding domain-containing protein [Dehalococcoidia bacterium]